MTVKITYCKELKKFLAATSFDQRKIITSVHGWDFDKTLPAPYNFSTISFASVAPLRSYCDETATKILNKVLIQREPWKGPLAISPDCPHLLEPWQVEGAYFALGQSSSYLGFDPGLGKTPTVSVAINTLHKHRRWRTLFVCPPNLVRNVRRELNTWTTLKVVTFDELRKRKAHSNKCDVILFPDSMIQDYKAVQWAKKLGFEIIVADEAHRFKTATATRTRRFIGFDNKDTGERFRGLIEMPWKRRILMSGTPMPNRPIELYPMLSKMAPETIDFMTEHQYALRFCAAKETRYGWDYKGASNLANLRTRTLTTDAKKPAFMLRKYKSLLKLPPVIEEVVTVDAGLTPALAQFEKELEKFGVDNVEWNNDGFSFINDDYELMYLSTYFRLMGEAMVKPAASIIKDVLDENEDERLLIFGIHKEAIANLASELKKYQPCVVTGDVPANKRQDIVDQFQNDKKHRIFLCNIDAAGVGYNITKATRVIFFEYKWGRYENRQGIDRVHRYGYKGDTLLVQYYALDGSLAFRKLDSIERKKQVTKYI